MSGAYFYIGPDTDEELHSKARRCSSQIQWGGEPVNHYAVAGGAVLGSVGYDYVGTGATPRYLPEQRLWGLIDGALYDGTPPRDRLSVFAEAWRQGKLEAILPGLNGAYFVVLWDPDEHAAVAVNDRYGMYPMFWAHTEDRFCLASRVLCAVLTGTVRGDWDLGGVAQMLTTNDVCGDGTLVKGVSWFPPGAVMSLRRGEPPAFRRYWNYPFAPDRSTPRAEWGGALGERFVEAVRRQCQGVDSVGVTLSGGLDSRCILAATRKAGIDADTFTWGKPDSIDRQFAAKVSQSYGARHHDHDYAYQRFPHIATPGVRATEGMVNLLEFHMLAHLTAMKGHANVILNGHAGDLILGGSYLRRAWLRELDTESLAQRLSAWRTTLLSENELTDVVNGSRDAYEHGLARVQYPRLLAQIEGLATPNRSDRFFLENRVFRNTILGTVQMRCAVESAACFFDYDLVDLMLTIPPELRHEHRIHFDMMRAVFPEAMKLPYQRTLLPAGAPLWAAVASKAFLKACRIGYRKVGWPTLPQRLDPVDFSTWLRGPLQPWMNEVMLETNAVADEAIQPDYCRKIWKDHLDGRERTWLLGALASIRTFGAVLADARARKLPESDAPLDVSHAAGPSGPK